MEAQRFCKKCLLKDISKDEYFKNVYEYISQLDESIKTPEPEYSRRLALCIECEKLQSGMCRVCGCFVEVRAAKIHNGCPDIEKKW